MWEPYALLMLGLAGWFWYDSMKARESAIAAGKGVCERDRLQFLDETVECVKTRPARNEEGTLVLRRTYRFEFSDNGRNRRSGGLVLLGATVESVYLEPYLVQ